MQLTLASQITLTRIVAVLLFIILTVCDDGTNRAVHLLLFAVLCYAVFTDWLDGFIARRMNQLTNTGALLDALADKLLMMSVYIVFLMMDSQYHYSGLLKVLLLSVIARDVILIGSAIILYRIQGQFLIQPSRLGKITCVLQAVCIFCLLTQSFALSTLWWLTLVFTLYTGIDYWLKGIKILQKGCAE